MKKVDTNMVIALAALVTSVVAVFIAWDESRLMRRSQEAAFIPIIEIEGGGDFTVPQVHLRVHNTGHGVAFVESMRFLAGDTPLTGWTALSSLFLNEELDRVADLSWDSAMGYYPVGEDRTVMSITFPEAYRDAVRQHLLYDNAKGFASLNVEACYCSVFGKCWTKNMQRKGRPEPTAVCTPTSDPMDAVWTSFVASRPEASSDE
ncbi:MAG: hypothetical protein AAFR65_06015 [Pseudomonadota bacterium]